MKAAKLTIYHLEDMINDLISWETGLSKGLPLSLYVVTQCLTLEKTLKCLIRFVHNGTPRRTHNLEVLMEQLPNETLMKLCEKLNIKLDDLKYALIKNKNVFNEWRYVVEEGKNTSYSGDAVMNGIITAGISVLQDRLDQHKSEYVDEVWIK